MSTLVITTDKADYAPGEPIVVTLSTDSPMVQKTTITGTAELPNGTTLTDETTTTITGTYTVAAEGFTAVQDPDNPAVFHLTAVA